KRRMNLVLWMVTTAPFTRSTSGATVPGSAPEATAPGGGAPCASVATTLAAAAQSAAVRRPEKTVVAHRACGAERLAAINDDAAGRIIGREGDRHLVAENHANAVLAQLPPEVGEDLMAILELDPEISGGEHLDDAPLELYMLFSTH